MPLPIRHDPPGPQASDSCVMNALPNPNPIDRRHLLWLLAATLLAQAVLFISYPLGIANHDDNQAAQAFLMDELGRGNLLIGNLRYNTGYAFVMAPLKSLTAALGRLGDRVFLLAQMAAYSTIPFMVYDMLRRRFGARRAFIAALVVLCDPFGLQWTHYQLPGWLVATTTVAALWLAQLAWQAPARRRLLLVALASLGLGVMCFARLNYAPLAAVYGASFFLWRHIPFRQRIGLFATVGCISGGLLGGYIALIHIPSTGATTLSCTSGATLLAAADNMRYPISARNGEHSAHYARLLTLPALREVNFYSETYPLYRRPGPWVRADEQAAFLAQPFGEPPEPILIVWPSALYWYLGPCAADALLYEVYLETVASDYGRLVGSILRGLAYMLVQDPASAAFPLQYLENPEQITWQGSGRLGFYEAHSSAYNGHRVWRPGVELFSALFYLVNMLKYLTPLALLAALWKRDWLLMTTAAILLLGLLLIASFASIEPRYYAMLAPMYTMLIGWLLGEIMPRALAFLRQ
ncbi:MAG: glycosyltransferase family 39 protein [Chloroflexi bacterium]|nr:glycosyltransferase family 39 protein [Chloroflexota bacterium]